MWHFIWHQLSLPLQIDHLTAQCRSGLPACILLAIQGISPHLGVRFGCGRWRSLTITLTCTMCIICYPFSLNTESLEFKCRKCQRNLPSCSWHALSQWAGLLCAICLCLVFTQKAMSYTIRCLCLMPWWSGGNVYFPSSYNILYVPAARRQRCVVDNLGL